MAQIEILSSLFQKKGVFKRPSRELGRRRAGDPTKMETKLIA